MEPRFEHDGTSAAEALCAPSMFLAEPEPVTKVQVTVSREELAAWLRDYEETEVSVDRHPNSARFHELLEEAGHLHDIKQKDYGRGDDPFANVRSSADWGMPAWVGAMVRLNDKVKRLQTLAKTGHLRNEGAYDSFMDIAVYALIAYVLFEQDQQEAAA